MPRRRNLQKVAKGLARGLSGADALRQAGYAESTIDKKGYQIIKRPQIQSFLTEALEALGVTARQILQPIKDGLEACEVVKTEDGKILTDHPDHKIRFMALDRAVALYGLGKGAEHPAPGLDTQPSPTYNIQVNFVAPKEPEPTPSPKVGFIDPNHS